MLLNNMHSPELHSLNIKIRSYKKPIKFLSWFLIALLIILLILNTDFKNRINIKERLFQLPYIEQSLNFIEDIARTLRL